MCPAPNKVFTTDESGIEDHADWLLCTHKKKRKEKVETKL